MPSGRDQPEAASVGSMDEPQSQKRRAAPPEEVRRLGIDADPYEAAPEYVGRLVKGAPLLSKPQRRGDSRWSLEAGAVVEVLDPRSVPLDEGGTAPGALIRVGRLVGWVDADAVVPLDVPPPDLAVLWKSLVAIYGEDAPPLECPLASTLSDLDADGTDELIVHAVDGIECRRAIAIFGTGRRAGELLAFVRTQVLERVSIVPFPGRGAFLAVEEQWVQAARWTGSSWGLYAMPESTPGSLRPVFQTTMIAIDGRKAPVEHLVTQCERRSVGDDGEWGIHCRRTVRQIHREVMGEQENISFYAFDGSAFTAAAVPGHLPAFEALPPLRITAADPPSTLEPPLQYR